jgi:uncharacterized DUF497 family protein
MVIELDIAKNIRNIADHGMPLTVAFGFEIETAKIEANDRRDYGETRYQALGIIGGRVHMLVFTMRGDKRRVISLRKANKRELRAYANR